MDIEARQEAVVTEITGTSGLPGPFDTPITASQASLKPLIFATMVWI